jgi:FtsP/CotA-like multicopper oxidase with cupredoxin domain
MANNMLIQGKGDYQCNNTELACTPNTPKAQFRFETGKKHLLRLINSGAEAIIFFAIDGYDMTVIANDFVPVVPYKTNLVKLAVGQRTDIIVEGKDDPTEAVWMRISEGPCECLTSPRTAYMN